MRVYKLTKLGIKVASGHSTDSDEMRVLQFVRDRGRVLDEELRGDDIYLIRRLKDRGLVEELTS